MTGSSDAPSLSPYGSVLSSDAHTVKQVGKDVYKTGYSPHKQYSGKNWQKNVRVMSSVMSWLGHILIYKGHF